MHTRRRLYLTVPYLHNRTVELLTEGQSLGKTGLRLIDDVRHEISDTVAEHSRGWHDADVLVRVLVLVCQNHVDPLKQ